MLQPTPFRLPGPGDEVSHQEWAASIEAWTWILSSFLRLPAKSFTSELQASDDLVEFLVSYLQEMSVNPRELGTYRPSKEMNRTCFLLIHRIWSTEKTPSAVLSPTFLIQFSIVFGTVKETPDIIDRVWTEKMLGESQRMLKHKLDTQQTLDSEQPTNKGSLETCLLQMRAFVKTCHEYGKFMMIGADLLDALIVAWNHGDLHIRNKITLITYSAFLTLMSDETRSLSILADHLYTLRMDHEKHSSSSLLAAMITATPFLLKYRRVATNVKSARITDLLPIFERIGVPPRKTPVSKGKQADRNEAGGSQVQQMTKISQVQDLFPDLGAGFLARLLQEYEQNPEHVIQHLLDSSLAPHLQSLDREESLESFLELKTSDSNVPSALSATRHNIYDFDDFDELAVAAGKLHIGKKEANPVLSEPANKASILSALATLDPDDDERDDTYDAEDVGGTVDMVKPEDDLADRREQPGEEQLFAAWMASPEMFGRDGPTRSSPERMKLRQDTGLTDEAIEGWAIMLEREPHRLRRLKAQYALPSMLQPELASTSWKSGAESDQDENGRPRRGGTARGRGRGAHRGNRGRGGSSADASGPSNEPSTQRARQRKDANKSSRANHSRRDQRAKKVARAGF